MNSSTFITYSYKMNYLVQLQQRQFPRNAYYKYNTTVTAYDSLFALTLAPSVCILL